MVAAPANLMSHVTVYLHLHHQVMPVVVGVCEQVVGRYGFKGYEGFVEAMEQIQRMITVEGRDNKEMQEAALAFRGRFAPPLKSGTEGVRPTGTTKSSTPRSRSPRR